MNNTALLKPCHSSRSSRLVAGTLLLLIGLGPASALADNNDADESRTRYSVGAALLLAKDGYRGVGRESVLIPGLSIQNKWVNLFGPQLDLRLIGDDKRSWWIGPRLEYRFDGYEKADSAIFTGMSDRKGGLFYGLAGSFDLGGGFEFEADYVKAASKEAGFSRGAVASLQLSRSYTHGAWAFVPRVGAEYQSSRYVDYYYGVRPVEATAARAAYAGKSSWSPEVGLLVRYRASPRQLIFANLNYERYAKEIRNSPLINASGIPQLILGYQYVLD